MSLASASGSAVGYEIFKHPLILLIKILPVSVVWTTIMLYLYNKMHDIILFIAIIISMIISLNKHIFDILCKSYFWNKLNMILPVFIYGPDSNSNACLRYSSHHALFKLKIGDLKQRLVLC